MFTIPGYGEKKDMCDFVKAYISCPGQHMVKPVKQSCQRIECPECYLDWASKASGRITDVLRGSQAAYRNVDTDLVTDYKQAIKNKKMVRRVNHFVLSPPPGFVGDDFNLNGLYRRLYLFMKRNHLFTGGLVIFHPYRLKSDIRKRLQAIIKENSNNVDIRDTGGLWALVHEDTLCLGSLSAYVYFSPHFHLLAFGGLPNATDFYRKTGWVYKNIGRRDTAIRIDEKTGAIIDEIRSTAKYLLSHCCVQSNENGRLYKTYRFFGLCSPARIRVQKEFGVPVIRKVYESFLKCPVCGERLVHCAPIEGVYSPYKDEKGEYRFVKTKLVFRKYEVIK